MLRLRSRNRASAAERLTASAEARLSRPMSEAKIAGVCAGFARYFGVDVTLVRILWVVLTVFPLPCFGLVAYIVAWIVMPKDPVTALGTCRRERPGRVATIQEYGRPLLTRAQV